MQDKNGKEMKAGMIVRISGAYFKNDNGLYFVENAPGDPNWTGKDLSLRKIGRTGKISTAKYNICFWPIGVFVSDRAKANEADRWNRAHAEIEAVELENMAEVKAHFEERAANMAERIQWEEWNFGRDCPSVIRNREIQAHFEAVAAAL